MYVYKTKARRPVNSKKKNVTEGENEREKKKQWNEWKKLDKEMDDSRLKCKHSIPLRFSMIQ